MTKTSLFTKWLTIVVAALTGIQVPSLICRGCYVVEALDAGGQLRSLPNAIGITRTANNDGMYSIIGGQSTSISKYPYTAAILSPSNVLLGGGFIVASSWVVTAGFTTFLADEFKVRLGSDSAYEGGQYLSVSKVITHPKFNGSWDWDVALLKLKTKAKFGKNVKLIKIGRNSPKTGSTGTVTGWGATSPSDTSRLQFLNIDIYDRETCDDKWFSTYKLALRTFCAYKSKCGPCYADYGDPLVSNGKAVGLYVGSYGCADDKFPALYSDLSQFYKWIKSTIRKKNNDEHNYYEVYKKQEAEENVVEKKEYEDEEVDVDEVVRNEDEEKEDKEEDKKEEEYEK